MRILILIVLSFASAHSHAGVRQQDKKTALALLAVTNDFDAGFTSTDGQAIPVDYAVNAPVLSGVEISYAGLSAAFLTSEGLSESDVVKKGKTSYEDARLSLYLGSSKQWVLHGFYNRYKGFYIENTQAVQPGATDYLQRPDIEMFNAGTSVMHVFSPDRYSDAAAYAQSDIQDSSGGSFLAMAGFDSNYLKAESEILPAGLRSQYGEQQNLKEARFLTTSLLGGYAHTFVWDGFFINLKALLGTGYQRQSYRYDDVHKRDTDQSFKQSLNVALGYNGPRFFIGAAFMRTHNEYQMGTVTYKPVLLSSKAYLGFRF